MTFLVDMALFPAHWLFILWVGSHNSNLNEIGRTVPSAGKLYTYCRYLLIKRKLVKTVCVQVMDGSFEDVVQNEFLRLAYRNHPANKWDIPFASHSAAYLTKPNKTFQDFPTSLRRLSTSPTLCEYLYIISCHAVVTSHTKWYLIINTHYFITFLHLLYYYSLYYHFCPS